MSIYTGYGDKGDTRLVGGTKVKKNHVRVEAYGTTDELCSQIGFVVALIPEEPVLQQELIAVQQAVFDCSSDLAVPNEVRPYKLTHEPVRWLEQKIDAYWAASPKIKQFVLPGGGVAAAAIQMARCLARRAERRVVALLEQEMAVNPQVLLFLNRLSDYFFALARWLNQRQGIAEITYQNSPDVFRNKRE